MTLLSRIECSVRREHGRKGSHRLIPITTSFQNRMPGRVPRIARLLALAHKFDGLIRQGVIADFATLARLGHVSRARITQIMNLLILAPDIQEEILFMPLTLEGHDPVPMRRLAVLVQTLDWPFHRALWRQLFSSAPERIHDAKTCGDMDGDFGHPQL